MPILAQPIVIGCLSAAALAELLPNLIKYILIKKANGQAINPKSLKVRKKKGKVVAALILLAIVPTEATTNAALVSSLET